MLNFHFIFINYENKSYQVYYPGENTIIVPIDYFIYILVDNFIYKLK